MWIFLLEEVKMSEVEKKTSEIYQRNKLTLTHVHPVFTGHDTATI